MWLMYRDAAKQGEGLEEDSTIWSEDRPMPDPVDWIKGAAQMRPVGRESSLEDDDEEEEEWQELLVSIQGIRRRSSGGRDGGREDIREKEKDMANIHN